MAGLDPAISQRTDLAKDGRVKPGHDDRGNVAMTMSVMR